MDIKLMPEKYKKGRESGPGMKISGIDFSQLAKKIQRPDFWLLASLGLLAVIVLVCLGMWGYKSSLTKQRDGLVERITEMQNQRNLDLENNFVELKQEIENLKKFLETHIEPSEIFVLFEELTLPQVQFTNFRFDLAKSKISLDLEAAGYNTLAKQIIIFEQDSRIKKADISEVELNDKGGVSSNLEIELEIGFLQP